jgi:hypothetical protein
MIELLSKTKLDLDYFIAEIKKFDGIQDIDVLIKEEKLYDKVT